MTIWRAIILATALLLGATSGAARAQALQQICDAEQGPTHDYRAASLQAEIILDSSRLTRGDDALKVLRAARLAPPSLNQIVEKAHFCLVAGRAMQWAQSGSARQAKLLMVSAFNLARLGGDNRLASQAALDLGLVSAAEGGSWTAEGVRGRSKDDAETRIDAILRNCAPSLEEVSLVTVDYLQAANALECASAIALANGNPALAAISNLRLARLNQSYGGEDSRTRTVLAADTRERLATALSSADKITDPELRGEVALRTIETMLAFEPADPRIDRGLTALERVVSGRPALSAYRDAMMARSAGARGDTRAQRDLLARAITAEFMTERPLQLANWYTDLAQADPGKRGEHLGAAYRALESVRPFLPRFDPITQESIFQLRIRDVFERAAEFQLSQSAVGTGNFDAAQGIIERYRQAELQAVFGNECVPLRDPLRPSDLTAGEVILYPVMLKDRIDLLVAHSAGEGFERLSSPVTMGRSEATRLARTMVEAITLGGNEWKAPAKQLYDAIVAPVFARFPGTTTLVVVPDGALRSVPFAALVDGQDRYLVESSAVVTQPALGFADPGQPSRPAPGSVLALSLSREVSLPMGTFPRLEGTREEAAAAAGERGVSIDDFTKADLKQALDARPTEIIHMSTHASFNGRADRAFIVANGEAIQLSELREMIADTQARGSLLSLLVLAACETAVGDDQANMGLAGAAVQAGAESALASLWQVNDLGTSMLMRDFYAHLRGGDSKVSALRKAQLSLIRSTSGNAAPNVWSAFILLGGWR